MKTKVSELSFEEMQQAWKQVEKRVLFNIKYGVFGYYLHPIPGGQMVRWLHNKNKEALAWYLENRWLYGEWDD